MLGSKICHVIGIIETEFDTPRKQFIKSPFNENAHLKLKLGRRLFGLAHSIYIYIHIAKTQIKSIYHVDLSTD